MAVAQKVSTYPYHYSKGKVIINIVKVKFFKIIEIETWSDRKVMCMHIHTPWSEGKVRCMHARTYVVNMNVCEYFAGIPYWGVCGNLTYVYITENLYL